MNDNLKNKKDIYNRIKEKLNFKEEEINNNENIAIKKNKGGINKELKINNLYISNWDVSKEKIIKKMKDWPVVKKDGDILIYKSKYKEFNVLLGFLFKRNRLVEIKYYIIKKNCNVSDYIKDYNKLRRIFIKEYGRSKIKEKIWKDIAFKERWSEARAIGNGYLKYRGSWQRVNTKIMLSLAGQKGRIRLIISYKKIEGLNQAETNIR